MKIKVCVGGPRTKTQMREREGESRDRKLQNIEPSQTSDKLLFQNKTCDETDSHEKQKAKLKHFLLLLILTKVQKSRMEMK